MGESSGANFGKPIIISYVVAELLSILLFALSVHSTKGVSAQCGPAEIDISARTDIMIFIYVVCIFAWASFALFLFVWRVKDDKPFAVGLLVMVGCIVVCFTVTWILWAVEINYTRNLPCSVPGVFGAAIAFAILNWIVWGITGAQLFFVHQWADIGTFSE
eukprot:TRINITY_DN7565_c0_g1_i1.p1 TRINITY_DN7565_c0_g1~~TRINITY_DN7565_c0_g1_i1.p1  ORF type:complete len:161 (+),score=21.67 TRINITY_DN7565_c0_g1_i1:147-629(+)